MRKNTFEFLNLAIKLLVLWQDFLRRQGSIRTSSDLVFATNSTGGYSISSISVLE